MNEFEVEERWRKTGLLEGHDGYESLVLANNLQEAVEYLMTRNPKNYQSRMGLFLPIVVRLFNEHNITSPNLEKLYIDLVRFEKENQTLLKTNEPEFCRLVADKYEDSQWDWNQYERLS